MTRTNEHGQPVGDPVPDWSPRPLPQRVVLDGAHVRLEPVADAHADDLHAALGGAGDDPLWTYRSEARPEDPDAMRALVRSWAARSPEVTWAILPAGERAAGLATLMRLDPAHGSVEVGSILFARSLQRTRAATEALHLLAAYVFDDLGYRRLEWKLDALNEPSARAARRLGFRHEGVFRQAMVYKGRSRDTSWWAMTDADWPRVRAAHRRWLDPANFDDHGRQRTSLSALS